MLYKVKKKSEINLDCFIILWFFLYMENNLTPKGDNDSNAIAFGDFTYDEAGKFLSVYISAFRAISLAFKTGGLDEAAKVQSRIMAQIMLAEKDFGEISVKSACAAVSYAFCSSITACDLVTLAEFSNKALEAAHAVYDKSPEIYQSSHIMFSASKEKGGIQLKVYAVPFDELDQSVEARFDKIISINNKSVGNN